MGKRTEKRRTGVVNHYGHHVGMGWWAVMLMNISLLPLDMDVACGRVYGQSYAGMGRVTAASGAAQSLGVRSELITSSTCN